MSLFGQSHTELEQAVQHSEDTQFLICEACGTTHCEPGNWVSVRKADSLVLVLPASRYVWGETEDQIEYAPPFYLKKRGIGYLDQSTYEGLRAKHSSFPPTNQIHPLKLKEATLIFQWNAPARLLGEPPTIRTLRDILVGSSEGDHVEQLEQLSKLLQMQYKIESPGQLRALTKNERVISFYLQTAEFMEWEAMAFDGSEYRLLVDSRYVIAPGDFS